MEIYIIVPDDLKKIYALYEICGNLFHRHKEKIFLYSNFNEKCIGVAREIALQIGCNFSVDQNLNSENKAAKEFPKKHYWPNQFIEILVLQGDIARVMAKELDPGCASDAISTDTLFRLKDIFPKEKENEEIDDGDPLHIHFSED